MHRLPTCLSLVLFVCAAVRAGDPAPVDKLPEHALARFGNVGLRHPVSTGDALWSPDGKQLLTAGGDGTIRFWSTATWAEAKRLTTPGKMHNMVLTPDHKRLIARTDDSEICVWDFEKGTLERKFKGLFNTVSLAISPDGNFVAAGGREVGIFEIATGKQIQKVALGKDDFVERVAYLPKGTILVGAFGRGSVAYWDVKTGEAMTSHAAGKGEVTGLVLSPDGRTLITSSEDGKATFWEAGTDKKIGDIQVHKGGVVLALSPDGKTLACGDRNTGGGGWGEPMVVLVDVETRAITKSIAATNRDIVTSLDWSPDGKLLVLINSGRARVWDVASNAEVLIGDGHMDHVLAVAISPDGSRVVTGGDDKTIRIWNAATAKSEAVLKGHTWAVGNLVFRKNGALLVSGAVPAHDSFVHRGKGTKDATLRVWDVASGKELRQIGNYSDWVQSLVAAPDDPWVYVCSGHSPIHRWNADTGESSGDIDTGERNPQNLVASKDGRWIAFSDDMTMDVSLWDLKAGKVVQTMKVRGSGTESLDFSPDGELLAERKGDSTVRFWETATGKQRSTLKVPPKSSPWSAAYSPNGEFLALGTGEGGATICRVKDGKIVMDLAGHLGPVQCIAWSGDGKRLATAGYDSTAILWDVSSLGEEKK
ncbi:MAG: WD40 repeat domain-containing protein [Planctomycetes bacterium]|nr:WD40 repeat domain-containing protein [Planctomycetota bacterium]